jgi:ornithine cyclodeaminase/alanine dehydrogenase-like protein (mu-crystallin family)
MALYLTEDDVAELLTMDTALEAVEEGFLHLAEGTASNFPRHRLPNGGGAFNFMAATAPGLGVMGLKVYGVGAGRPRFLVYLHDTGTGELIALIEASGMGKVRTGAASGVATKYMAREDASTVGMIGSGYQASTQLEAVCKVRGVTGARVFSRTRENRERLASEMERRLGIEVRPVESGRECVEGADIVNVITSASKPVLLGEWLSPGVHVNAAGNNHWMKQEIDYDAVRRSGAIVTDDVEGAKIECGDLVYAVDRGITSWDRVRSLSDIVTGKIAGRSSEEEITLFESQGVAVEDIAVGIRVYRMALERGLGQPLPL